jgi:peptidoglycan hydrolase-like protein with peptidoglycan-binding domain
MTPTHARYAVCVFMLLSTCVAGNLMFMQENHGAGRGQTTRAQARGELERGKRSAAPQQAPETIKANTFNTAPIATTQSLSIAPLPAHAPKPIAKLAAAEVPTSGGPDASDVVAAIQRELQARGYEPGLPDGAAGIVTRAAIMAWEFDHGLALTGEPTEALKKAIVLGVSAALTTQIQAQYQALPKEKRARTEVLIRTVQSSLSALGYNAGKVTGRITEDTVRSIREFEVDQNLVQSGRISGPVVARLLRLSGMGRPTAR